MLFHILYRICHLYGIKSNTKYQILMKTTPAKDGFNYCPPKQVKLQVPPVYILL